MKTLTVDAALLENCLFAFNAIPNTILGNDVKTYALASELSGIVKAATSGSVGVDVTLLKNCLYAFNEIPNTRLGNGVKTYALASELSGILRKREVA